MAGHAAEQATQAIALDCIRSGVEFVWGQPPSAVRRAQARFASQNDLCSRGTWD